LSLQVLSRVRRRRQALASLVLLSLSIILLIALNGCKSESQASPPSVVFLTPGQDIGHVGVPASNAKLTVSEPDPDGVEFTGISFGADGALITVGFKAPPEVAQGWLDGSIYVVDEASGRIYNEVPVMPVIGPLFARPKESGQSGYVMLTNYDRGIKSGSAVTVVIGFYKREHVIVP